MLSKMPKALARIARGNHPWCMLKKMYAEGIFSNPKDIFHHIQVHASLINLDIRH